MSGDHNQYQYTVYNEWRQAEAHQVPMTEQGKTLAESRWRGFEKGYISGMKAAAKLLESEHKKVKDSTGHHNYFLVSANAVRDHLKEITQ
jgi:hypothetical protein